MMKRARPRRKWKKLEDNSPFPPWGKHAGEKMINVPADYLLWLDEQGWSIIKHPSFPGAVHEYIQDNMDALKKEVNDD